MNSQHLLLYSLIAFMFLSSVVCILYVTIENHRAVKKYYKSLPSNDLVQEKFNFTYDPEDYVEVSFFPKPTPATTELSKSETSDYRIAS